MADNRFQFLPFLHLHPMLKTLIRAWFALTLICLLIGTATAQVACPPPPQALQYTPEQVREALQQARDRGFLWRIRKNGRTSYLYGTIHVAQRDWVLPGPNVLRALASSDTVALEIDALDPAMQQRLASSMTSAPGTALPEPLTQRLRAQADQACLPYAALAPLAPELQIATLSMLTARAQGLHTAFGIDLALAGMARGAKKTVRSLETPEAQMQTLGMSNANDTIAFVQDSLDDLESGRAQRMLTRLAQAWAQSDFEQFSRFEQWCECMKTPLERSFMKRLNDDRNPALARQIDALHRDSQGVFAAVGSLHLFGAVGLPTLMQGLGYQVERVAFGEPR